MKKNLVIVSLVLAMALTLTACGGGGESTPGLTDGTYEGTGAGRNGDVVVSVEVKDGKISRVDVLSHEETDGIADPAINDLPAAIVKANSADVDSIASATMTSDAIKEAVNNALKGAK